MESRALSVAISKAAAKEYNVISSQIGFGVMHTLERLGLAECQDRKNLELGWSQTFNLNPWSMEMESYETHVSPMRR